MKILESNTTLEDILQSYSIPLTQNNKLRNVVDVLEDLYLKISTNEYIRLMSDISTLETTQGHIFDQARNKPYE